MFLQNVDINYRQLKEISCGMACISFFLAYSREPVQLAQSDLFSLSQDRNLVDNDYGIRTSPLTNISNSLHHKMRSNLNIKSSKKFKIKYLTNKQLESEIKKDPIIALVDGPILRNPDPSLGVEYGHFIVILKTHEQFFLIWDPDNDKNGGFFLTSPLNLSESCAITDNSVIIYE